MKNARPGRSAWWQEYTTFSRSQRRAIFVLATLLVGIAGLRYYLRIQQAKPVAGDANIVASVSRELVLADSAYRNKPRYTSGDYKPRYPSSSSKSPAAAARLAPFDPNDVAEADLLGFGLRPAVAQAWVRYLEKGGRFRTAEDLRKLRVLPTADAERLMPYVRINTPAQETTKEKEYTTEPDAAKTAAGASFSPGVPRYGKKIMPVDVNTADSTALVALPGIGEKRASALLKYRDRLGGFLTLQQIGEVKAIPDTVLEKLSTYLILRPEAIRPVNLNTATVERLGQHPYIGWRYAKIIVAYREQHGPFARVDDLLKIHVLSEAWLQPLRPYLIVQ